MARVIDRAVRALCAVYMLALCTVIVACRGRDRAGGDSPYADRVAEDVPKIEKALGVKFKRPPKLEVRSRAQVREFVLAQLEDSVARRELSGKEAAYKVLGLIPDSMDTRKLLLDLYTEQILGYYDPKTDVLYVLQGAPDEYLGITIMHELVHALQDQYIDLDSLQRPSGDDDQQVAAQAVIEGQATFEQLGVMVGGRGNVAASLPGGWDSMGDVIRESYSAQPVFSAAPMVIKEELLFPYINGMHFVRRFREREPAKLPFADMPRSSEQVLHDDAFFKTPRDAPARITLPPLANRIYENGFGEFGTRLVLFEHLRDRELSSRAAMGWGGDRYVVVRTPSGNAIAWVTAWDSALDAAEFVDALGAAARRRFRSPAPTVDASGVRTFNGRSRTMVVTPRELAGRNVVLVVDVPTGVSPQLLDLTRVTIGG